MAEDGFKRAVETRLADVFKAQLQEAPSSDAKVMIQRLRQLVLRAGKRSRPRLLQLTYEAYGGKNPAILVDIGAALELHHQFLLVHDDIMDNDTVRYDGPNMLGYYRQDFPAEESDIADSMALMAGNLLFTFANQLILGHPDLPAVQKVSLLQLMHKINIGVQAGQQLDVINVVELNPAITPESLLQTAYLKTALYSIALPMQTAAELCNLAQAERQKIDKLAKTCGILYQLVDDYSDYFTNASSFESHPKYRDFKQGKITYPLWSSLQHSPPKVVALLKARAGNKQLSDTEMSKIAELLEGAGAKKAALQQIDEYYQEASVKLKGLALSNETSRKKFASMLDSFRV